MLLAYRNVSIKLAKSFTLLLGIIYVLLLLKWLLFSIVCVCAYLCERECDHTGVRVVVLLLK